MKAILERAAQRLVTGQPRALLCLMAAIFVVYASSPAVNVGDSRLSLPTAVSIYRHGDLTLDEFPQVETLRGQYDVDVHDGHLVMGYPYAPALFLVPVAIVVDLVPGIDPAGWSITQPNRTWILELPVASLLVVASIFCFLLAARASRDDRPDHRRGSDLIVMLILAFGTLMWSCLSRGLSQHAAAAPFIALVIYLAVRSRADPRLVPRLGFVVALAYVMRPTASVVVVCVTAWIVICHRSRLLRYLANAAVVAVPFVAINVWVYGSVLPPYYSAGKFVAPQNLAGHLAGLMVSPSRGLLLYSPVLLLAPVGMWLRRRQRRLDSVDVLFISIVVGTILVAAIWPNWWGGSTFGPRLLAEAIPFLCWFLLPVLDAILAARDRDQPVAAHLTWRWAVAVVSVLAVVSVAIQSQGAATRATLCWNSKPNFIDEHPERLWEWSDPQPLRAISELLRGESPRDVVLGSCRDTGGVDIQSPHP